MPLTVVYSTWHSGSWVLLPCRTCSSYGQVSQHRLQKVCCPPQAGGWSSWLGFGSTTLFRDLNSPVSCTQHRTVMLRVYVQSAGIREQPEKIGVGACRRSRQVRDRGSVLLCPPRTTLLVCTLLRNGFQHSWGNYMKRRRVKQRRERRSGVDYSKPECAGME